jgi:L-2-hydroxycarboxylate dehydrogenase (NAD+)
MAKLLFRVEELKNFVVAYFVRLGIPEQDARTVAEVLVSADLRGVDSHGVIRLSSYYGSRLRKGLISKKPEITVVTETPATLALDGGAGLGHVVGVYAMSKAIEKARQSGVAMVTVRNSNHYGIAGYYAMMALPHDMIGISYTNSQPLVSPTYGRKAVLGTNPIAVAVPALEERPYVLDMATSIVPIGRITVYQKAGKQIPEGWGIDQDGQVTVDPNSVLNGGALLPLGGPDFMRGYKGYGLAMLVDIFSGVLSGAAFLTSVGMPGTNLPANVGHFFAAVRLDAFRPAQEFKAEMDNMIRELKNSPKAVGQERIYIPGEKEFELSAKNLRDGVPLMEEVVEVLRTAGAEVDVPFDLEVLGRIA